MGSPYDQTMNSGQGQDLYGRTDFYPMSNFASSGRRSTGSPRSIGSGMNSLRSSPSGGYDRGDRSRGGVTNPPMDGMDYAVPMNTTDPRSSSPGGQAVLPEGTPNGQFNRPRIQTPSSGPYAGGEEMYRLERGPSPTADSMAPRYRDTIPPQSPPRFVSPRSPVNMPSSTIGVTSPLPPPPPSGGGPPLSMKSGAAAAALAQHQRRTAAAAGTTSYTHYSRRFLKFRQYISTNVSSKLRVFIDSNLPSLLCPYQ